MSPHRSLTPFFLFLAFFFEIFIFRRDRLHVETICVVIISADGRNIDYSLSKKHRATNMKTGETTGETATFFHVTFAVRRVIFFLSRSSTLAGFLTGRLSSLTGLPAREPKGKGHQKSHQPVSFFALSCKFHQPIYFSLPFIHQYPLCINIAAQWTAFKWMRI